MRLPSKWRPFVDTIFDDFSDDKESLDLQQWIKICKKSGLSKRIPISELEKMFQARKTTKLTKRDVEEVFLLCAFRVSTLDIAQFNRSESEKIDDLMLTMHLTLTEAKSLDQRKIGGEEKLRRKESRDSSSSKSSSSSSSSSSGSSSPSTDEGKKKEKKKKEKKNKKIDEEDGISHTGLSSDRESDNNSNSRQKEKNSNNSHHHNHHYSRSSRGRNGTFEDIIAQRTRDREREDMRRLAEMDERHLTDLELIRRSAREWSWKDQVVFRSFERPAPPPVSSFSPERQRRSSASGLDDDPVLASFVNHLEFLRRKEKVLEKAANPEPIKIHPRWYELTTPQFTVELQKWNNYLAEVDPLPPPPRPRTADPLQGMWVDGLRASQTSERIPRYGSERMTEFDSFYNNTQDDNESNSSYFNNNNNYYSSSNNDEERKINAKYLNLRYNRSPMLVRDKLYATTDVMRSVDARGGGIPDGFVVVDEEEEE